MFYFNNDYNEICYEAVLERITQLTGVQMPGYGVDECCDRAKAMIRKLCENEQLDVHFLSGGTQTNLTVIAASLRPHQCVIAADSGHISVHETGAIEATGHKVLELPACDGKITAQQIRSCVDGGADAADLEHMVQPKMVYISYPTELGTLYTLQELEQIREVCDRFGLYLFVDGARLGYGLAADSSGLTMKALAQLCDVFYIGGTKVGAMFGEAVVISNSAIAQDFRYLMKQRGGMLAKGWLLGAQFEALLENGLYFDIAKKANEQADLIRTTLSKCKVPLLVETTTNQVFPIIPNSILPQLSRDFTFAPWQTVDDTHTAIRFCTSWATKPENTQALCETLERLLC